MLNRLKAPHPMCFLALLFFIFTLDAEEPTTFPLKDKSIERIGDRLEDQADMAQIETRPIQFILNALGKNTQEQLEKNINAGIGFNNLMRKPEDYRGKVVSLSGYPVLSSECAFKEGKSGVKSLWHVILVMPDSKLCSFLTTEKPVEPLDAEKPVSIVGIFLKRHAFLNQEQGEKLSLAPLVIGKTMKFAADPAAVAKPNAAQLKIALTKLPRPGKPAINWSELPSAIIVIMHVDEQDKCWVSVDGKRFDLEKDRDKNKTFVDSLKATATTRMEEEHLEPAKNGKCAIPVKLRIPETAPMYWVEVIVVAADQAGLLEIRYSPEKSDEKSPQAPTEK
ncbi:MAG: hypothetical protein HY291_16970 [Planctomycetes bacterium]|nr:hypothetical protein [Planctomycetota bacterium]